MTVVKALLVDGTTICATIHSPTSYTFSLFDRMMMLVRGQVVYFGPQGATAVDFFKSNKLAKVRAAEPGGVHVSRGGALCCGTFANL